MTRKEEKDRAELAAVEKMHAHLEAYERQYPNITVGEMMRMENAALEAEEAATPGPRPEWRSGSIDIQLNSGRTVKMSAEIFGPLAVHPMLWSYRKRPLYSLAHLATTKLILNELTYTRAKYLAERFAYLDWGVIDGSAPAATQEKAWIIFQAASILRLDRKRKAQSAKGASC